MVISVYDYIRTQLLIREQINLVKMVSIFNVCRQAETLFLNVVVENENLRILRQQKDKKMELEFGIQVQEVKLVYCAFRFDLTVN